MNADTDRLARPTSEFEMEMPGVILSPLTLKLFPIRDEQHHEFSIMVALNLGV